MKKLKKISLGGQSIEISASTSVLPMNTQDRSPLEWTGWIPLGNKKVIIINIEVEWL